MRRLLSLGLFAFVACAQAELNYVVHVQPDTTNLHITVRIPDAGEGVRLQIPNWAPGSYRLVDNYKSVKNLKAKDEKGNELKIDQKIEKLSKPYGDDTPKKVAENDLCTWTVAPAKAVTIEYDMTSNVLDGSMHWSGPSTYIYPVGRTQESCTIDLRLPDGWRAYTGLNEGRTTPGVYRADTYDILADNPVSTGELLIDTYISRGKTHTVAMRGRAKANVDRAYLVKACKFVTDMQTHLFDGAPYDKYVWHFSMNDSLDGAGGLEHLSSTQISLAAGVGPRAVSVLSHEFFHLWNVKRIRTRVLGPFDYTKLPDTGALWWLEGVTDYYAHTLLYRYNWWGLDGYYKDVIQNLNAVRNNPGRLEVSPFDSSWRVAEAANGRGNSNGYKTSYYDRGWLCGMVLDIELRSLTGGKHNLDDVLLALWNLNSDDKPGFEEDEIRRQLVKFGGMEMGWFYDNVILKPGDMPVEAALAKCGLKLTEVDEAFADLGFTAVTDTGGGRVVGPTGPATDKLMAGDMIVAINGKEITASRREISSGLSSMMTSAKVGEVVKLTIKRKEETLQVEITPIAGSRKVKKIVSDPNATSAQKALGANWLAQRKF